MTLCITGRDGISGQVIFHEHPERISRIILYLVCTKQVRLDGQTSVYVDLIINIENHGLHGGIFGQPH